MDIDKGNKVKGIFKKYLGEDVDMDKLMKADNEKIKGEFIFILIEIYEENIDIINITFGQILKYFTERNYNYWLMGNNLLITYLIKEEEDKNMNEIEKFFKKQNYDIKISIFFGISDGIRYNIKYENIFFPNIFLSKLDNLEDYNQKKEENKVIIKKI